MVETAERRQTINTALHRALRRGEFIVLYQPTINLATGRIAGAEALVRWVEPRRGLLDAEEFIPVAEDSGLIVPLGAWVLSEAFRDAATWQRELPGRDPLQIAVNLSARQLLEPDLVDVVAATLERAKLAANSVRVSLEITESVIMRDRPAAQDTLARLKKLGVHLAVDDFGMGYGSFAYLRELPVDVLKVDRSFVAGMDANEQDRAIVESVISMGKNLDLTVIAEGVETQQQLDALRSLGCGYAQGFYFAPPLPPRTMSRVLRRDPRW